MTEPAQGTRTAAGTGFALVALAAALWGTDALFRAGLANELPAAAVVFAEHLIIVLLGAPYWRRTLRAARTLTARDWVYALLIGAGASALATALFTAAFRFGDPTTPLLLQKMQPLLAVLGARLLLGERLLPHYALYFLLAVSGAYLITFPTPGEVSVSQLVPAMLALGAAGLWGMGTVLGRGMTARVDTASLTGLRFGIGLPASALVLLAMEGPAGFVVYRTGDLLPLLALALVPGLISLTVYYRGLARTPASAATLAELAFPLSALVINYAVFGQALTWSQWLGIGVLTTTITVMGLAAGRGARTIGIRLEPGDRRVTALQSPT